MSCEFGRFKNKIWRLNCLSLPTKKALVPTKRNTNRIEELRKDKSSDPKQPIDCSRWHGK